MKYAKYIITIHLLVLLSLSAFAQFSPSGVPNAAIERAKVEERIALASGKFQLEGIASYYGVSFHKKKTANGEVFNMHNFTAAHRTLPFNTIVKVTNMYNGKTVTVRINDRGPYLKNRVIDLSQRAAQKIGMIGRGTANVTIAILHMGKKSIEAVRISDGSVRYNTAHDVHVQIASYSHRERARALIQTLSHHDLKGIIEPYNNFYRVIIPYVQPKEINQVLDTLNVIGHYDVLVRKP